VTRREWIGVALAAADLAFLAATIGATGHSAHAEYTTARLVPYVGLAALGGLAIAATAPPGSRQGPALGVAAGLLWAASDTSIKGPSAGSSAMAPAPCSSIR
jgi:hypothetical protein